MSGLAINIRAGATVKESTATATGCLVNIIADSERSSFGIGSDADLKRAIGKYFGREPTDAFLHSPTPWGDLYKKYGWPQVQRVLRPIKAEILEVKTQPTVLSYNKLVNESNKTAMYTSKITEQVTDTVSNAWHNSHKISVGASIHYDVSLAHIFNIGGEIRFDYEYHWGKSGTVSKQVTAGMETGVTVELKPRESAIVELIASRGTMKIRVTYEAHLTGSTAVNYNHGYKDYHFWALPIAAVIGAANKVQVVEDIEVGFYSNATATVKNEKTNEEMLFHMVDHSSEPSSDDYPGETPSAYYQDE